ncbi:BPSS1780 family membrane protein [Ottowia testudinis]|uniref:Uncharacterized protein n=1 Tax=Ottowia testudinis TaxID=2816950 RepID=A0A975CJ52_9BURK|nr:BPSS1780 family membrane protein [Ottowia testudinis]QTD46722.1 hypothetical protein J1M35_07580 [Ottowia testudinis]
MKLNIVPARTGSQWVREGVRLFFGQPLAFAGLFFMFLAATTVVSMLPLVGDVLALVLVPAGTVGLMAAAREASNKRFPMPVILATAFRQSPERTRAMLMLGVLYALAVVLIVTAASLMDDGQLAALVAKHGGRMTPELLADPALQQAARASMAQMALAAVLYLPVSILFWHAPALVHWHGVPVDKSLFFSAVAVLRNTGAYFIYAMGWVALTMLAWMALLLVAGMVGNLGVALSGMFPVSLAIATMVAASLWATFRDSFSSDAAEVPQDSPPSSN